MIMRIKSQFKYRCKRSLDHKCEIRRIAMKRRTVLLIFVLLGILYLVSDSFAQSSNRAWGAEGTFTRMYNPRSIEVIEAEVVGVKKFVPTKGSRYGIHLIVQTESEKISVHLGPGWYIENQNIMIEPKDKIVVKGSRIIFKGNPAIIAAEVKKGNDVLKLRDENGFPAWSGWRR
jgi:hypothetical protein